MCRSWYVPIFLLRDGSLTQMYKVSFIGPSDAMFLPAYYGEAVHTDKMSCGPAVLIDGRGGSKVFFEPIPKGLSRFTDILLLTFCLGAFVPLNYPTLLNSGLLVLRCH